MVNQPETMLIIFKERFVTLKDKRTAYNCVSPDLNSFSMCKLADAPNDIVYPAYVHCPYLALRVAIEPSYERLQKVLLDALSQAESFE